MLSETDKKNVQVSMVKPTLDTIESLKSTFHTNNRSDIVRSSIEIAAIVANAIKDGGHVILEDSNGKQREILIPGL